MEENKLRHLPYLHPIAHQDAMILTVTDTEYGASWKQRGGVGAFMMLARKWDRLEQAVLKHGYDIFDAADADRRPEGVMDDIRDLRRYLMLVEAELRAGGANAGNLTQRDQDALKRYREGAHTISERPPLIIDEPESSELVQLFRNEESEWGCKGDDKGWTPEQTAAELIRQLRRETQKLREELVYQHDHPGWTAPKIDPQGYDWCTRSMTDRRQLQQRRKYQVPANSGGMYAREVAHGVGYLAIDSRKPQYSTRRVSPERRAPA